MKQKKRILQAFYVPRGICLFYMLFYNRRNDMTRYSSSRRETTISMDFRYLSFGRIVEQHQIKTAAHFLQCFRNRIVDGFHIFIPVLQFPGVAFRITLHHALVTDLRFGDDPDHNKLLHRVSPAFRRTVSGTSRGPHFACEWCVDRHNIVILECFQSEIDRYFIFIIADILLEEIRTAVDFLSARFENAVRQRNDCILCRDKQRVSAPWRAVLKCMSFRTPAARLRGSSFSSFVCLPFQLNQKKSLLAL